MKIVRKLALTTAASFLIIGMAGAITPAAAKDSSWGCGGMCRTGPSTGN
ncbi:MAG: hypothetical protein WB471_01755 [Nocardioides sp.]